MSALTPIDILAALFNDPTAAALKSPENIYKIIEKAILFRLGHAARTICASTLHAFVREIAFNWTERPDSLDVSEWFESRETLADADLGVEAYIRFFNPEPVSQTSAESTVSTYSPTPSQLSPPDDFDEDSRIRLGFDEDELHLYDWA
jgi:hypothetical protein